jgi:DNA-directed RNA polymerase subunit delta
MNTEQLSMIEVAVELLNQKKTPQLITTLITEVLELKGLDDPNGVLATQLYIDITTSSSFVFCGEGKWDLKTRQSLEVFDRDGSFFNTGEEYEEEEEDINLDDYNIDEDDEYSMDDDDEDEDDDDYYDEYDLPLDDIDPTEDDDEVSYLDEQEYNDIMDDYESMYEDN